MLIRRSDRAATRRATSAIDTGLPMSSTRASPGAADGAGLDDQLHRLLDGHEEPGDVRVGDGDGPAPVDLGLEGGEHRPPAAEDVAEAHAQVRRLGDARRSGW